MCYIMSEVNHDMEEREFDYYLSLARIFDEGYPSIAHAPISSVSIPEPPTDGISEKCESTPEECATSDAPLWE